MLHPLMPFCIASSQCAHFPPSLPPKVEQSGRTENVLLVFHTVQRNTDATQAEQAGCVNVTLFLFCFCLFCSFLCYTLVLCLITTTLPSALFSCYLKVCLF